jgi:glutathione S-transferase
MIKLYGGARSRAALVQWYLEEIKVPYEFVLVDLHNLENRQPHFLAINPMGKVPAIVDGDFQLWESGAILFYLAQKHGQIPDSLEVQATMSQWICFSSATLAPGIFSRSTREQETPKLMTPLNQLLEKQPFMMGDEFSVVDVAVGGIVVYIPSMFKMDFHEYPGVLDYIKRLSERPAFQKAVKLRA